MTVNELKKVPVPETNCTRKGLWTYVLKERLLWLGADPLRDDTFSDKLLHM